jgi:hypothetical protein
MRKQVQLTNAEIDIKFSSGQWPSYSECVPFCMQWHDSNREQVEVVTGLKARLVYCERVGPGQYDLEFQIGKKTVNWFGSACCSFAAMAKAYQSYYNECC